MMRSSGKAKRVPLKRKTFIGAIVRAAPDAAIAADPIVAGYWTTRAALELEQAPPDLPRAASDLAEGARLDPNNLENRLRYAEVLEKVGQKDRAREQYELALWYNDQLTKEERKRLPPEKVAEVRKQIEKLNRPAGAAKARSGFTGGFSTTGD